MHKKLSFTVYNLKLSSELWKQTPNSFTTSKLYNYLISICSTAVIYLDTPSIHYDPKMLLTNEYNSDSEVNRICETYSCTVDNNTYTSNGSYSAVLTNSYGSDPSATLSLIIHPHNYGSEAAIACNSFSCTEISETNNSSGTCTAVLTKINEVNWKTILYYKLNI